MVGQGAARRAAGIILEMVKVQASVHVNSERLSQLTDGPRMVRSLVALC